MAKKDVKDEKTDTQEPIEPINGEDEEIQEEDQLAALREKLEEAEGQAAEYLDGWQRAQAEFSNYKKRQEADRVQVVERANATLLTKLLPVVDDFERALTTLPDNLDQLTWCKGVLMIKQKLDAILESEGVTSIEIAGRPFDPHFHEAVTYEEAPGYEEGQVIGQVQKGYLLGERVLRPALVRVAKVSPVAEPEEENADANEEKE